MGSGKVMATLPPLKCGLCDKEIAKMGIDDFLVKYGGVARSVSDLFAAMRSQRPDHPCVDLDVYMSLVGIKARSTALKTLRQAFVLGTDYIEVVDANGQNNGKKLVLLTPNCFKRMCMQSRAIGAEAVRTYFLRMETLTRMYFAAVGRVRATHM